MKIFIKDNTMGFRELNQECGIEEVLQYPELKEK